MTYSVTCTPNFVGENGDYSMIGECRDHKSRIGDLELDPIPASWRYKSIRSHTGPYLAQTNMETRMNWGEKERKREERREREGRKRRPVEIPTLAIGGS